ncbi:glycerate kinase [Rhodococcoides kyotonense]|uniref:Glycerate kinase n=1 Tax=Rhodococcoides kyotonense TaxID=398843 RepID=A0A177YGP4_9NOCA|nr:glycerate kinase [Rhodococcus kyotonensis]OAK54399.1 glycerate kinase [Rhodococcus kyotonensis]
MEQKRLTVVTAPDSFKGSCSASEAAAAMADGVRDALGPAVTVIECPLADGGEGTLDALAAGLNADIREVDTVDAIGRPRRARVAVSADGTTGVIEAAEANGLPHVSDVDLQPMRADSYGVGILARHLMDEGVTDILLCIGGSASNDGGMGFASALGVKFLDESGVEVASGAQGLGEIRSVDMTGRHPRAADVHFRVALDVDNPLLGSRGAASVFGPQKGATPEQVQVIDAGLANLAAVLADSTGVDARELSGAGAAGGMPACLSAVLTTEFLPGSELVMGAVGFRELCAQADLVLTGEGSFDSQSLNGKVVAGVAGAVPSGCPVVVVAGRVMLDPKEARDAGITAAVSIASGPSTLVEMTDEAIDLIRSSASHIAAMYGTFSPSLGHSAGSTPAADC